MKVKHVKEVTETTITLTPKERSILMDLLFCVTTNKEIYSQLTDDVWKLAKELQDQIWIDEDGVK